MKSFNILRSTLGATSIAIAMIIAPIVSENCLQSVGVEIDFGVSAHAQNGQNKKRRLPGISEKVLKDLGKVQEFTNPDQEKNPGKEPNFKAAYKELNRIERRCEACNPYEKSQVYNMFAYVAYTLEKYDEAIGHYKKVIAQSPNIPVGVELQSMLYVAQLSFQRENYNQAIQYLDKWMKLAKETNNEIGPQIWQLKAVICYNGDKLKCAIDSINKAVSIVEERGGVAEESWYGLQRALYFNRDDYKTATKILEKVIKHYPKKSYWAQLGSMYGLLEREDDQLGALDTTYLIGGLSKEKQLVNLVYLYLGSEVPAKAAQIMEKGMKDKIIPRSEEYLDVLALAYIQAKEPEKAIEVLEELGKISKSGDTHARLVGNYLDLDQPKNAIRAGNQALKKGKFKKASRSEVLVNVGIAHFEVKQFDKAIKSLERATKDKKYGKLARSWLRHTKAEKTRYETLKSSLAKVGLDIEKVIQ